MTLGSRAKRSDFTKKWLSITPRATWRAGWYLHALEDAGSAGHQPEKKTLHASEQTRPDVALSRQIWQAQQPELALERLVFLDETWASTNMTPSRGRSQVGTRCVGHAPYGHWKTTTVVCALRCEGLVAPWVIDGPINGQTFRIWLEEVLVPVLHPGDIVVPDNLGSHKVAGIAEAMMAAGAQLRFLPPYSPDLNPIEQVFSKMKPYLRKAAKHTYMDSLQSIRD